MPILTWWIIKIQWILGKSIFLQHQNVLKCTKKCPQGISTSIGPCLVQSMIHFMFTWEWCNSQKWIMLCQWSLVVNHFQYLAALSTRWIYKTPLVGFQCKWLFAVPKDEIQINFQGFVFSSQNTPKLELLSHNCISNLKGHILYSKRLPKHL